jgi:DMSO/TMAO reductase YedYZ molybdopterin-dependent catalytic subunit
LVGALSAGIALGVGELVAAFVRPAASPVIVVGNRFVRLTPESVKRWAIRNFGTNDKHVLLTGIYVVIALFAIIVGVLAVRRLSYGLAGITAFGAIGVYCALTSPASRGSDVIPTILGTVAAGGAMTLLTRAAGAALPAADTPQRHGPDRRLFMQGSAAAAGLAVITGFLGRTIQHARFDVSAARAKVKLPPVTEGAVSVAGTDLDTGTPWQTPNSSFYRIDTALSVPQIDPGSWTLRVHGMVDREITLNYADLLARAQVERWITLCCVSNEIGGNLIGNALFRGVLLADVLREAGVHPDSDQLLMTSSDGMTIGAPTAALMDGRDAMIAIAMNGDPLPIVHGFPARIVVPGLYGYVSACKWVIDLEATTFASRQAYWVQGGWAAQTDIKLESRIDTPHNGARVPAGRPVAIAGVAWDQHVGISKIEIQINNGNWMPARLAAVPSTDTWRQWVVEWTPPAAGSYVIRVRATDAAGAPQSTQVRDPYPSGATGLHAITVRAR